MVSRFVGGWESNIMNADDIVTFSALYVNVRPPYVPIEVLIDIDGETIDGGEFVPQYSNRFQYGFYGRGTELKVRLSGVGDPPAMRNIQIEFAR